MVLYHANWFPLITMVFIKTVASIKREEEIVETRNQLSTKLEELTTIATDMTDLTRLKTILRNVEKLCAGKRVSSEEALRKKREENKKTYEQNKESILESQRESRKKRRVLKEEFEAEVKSVVDSKIEPVL